MTHSQYHTNRIKGFNLSYCQSRSVTFDLGPVVCIEKNCHNENLATLEAK